MIYKKQYVIVKTQLKFKSERHNAFTEKKEKKKINVNSNDDQIMQSIDSIETYTCRTS